MLLKGKTAVVTGGSRGIGLAIVKRFLEEGANVALCGSREETAQKALDGILAENPDAPVMAIWPSVADEAALEAAFRQVAERFGGLDIVCNNAGISQSTPLIINTSSMVSKMGQPSGVAYPMSKFAVNGITISLARELGPRGIRVNAVAPGVTATDMVASLPEPSSTWRATSRPT